MPSVVSQHPQHHCPDFLKNPLQECPMQEYCSAILPVLQSHPLIFLKNHI